MTKIWLLTYIFCITSLQVFAQKTQFKNMLNFSVGARRQTQQSSNINFQKPDFLNNLYQDNYKLNRINYLGFDFRKSLDSTQSIRFSASSQDDKYPLNFDLAYYKAFNKNLGISAGIGQFVYQLSNPGAFNFKYEYQRFEPLEKQRNIITSKNRNLYLGPYFRFINKSIWFESTLNIGAVYKSKDKLEYLLFNTNSYETGRVIYNSMPSIKAYIQPVINFIYFPIHFKKSSLGLQLIAKYNYTNRSYNYKRRTDIWTAENPINEKIKAPLHIIQTIEIDFGITWKN